MESTAKNELSFNESDGKQPNMEEAIIEAFFTTDKMKTCMQIGSLLFLGVVIFEIFHTCGSVIDFSQECDTIERVAAERARESQGPVLGAVSLWTDYFSKNVFFTLVNIVAIMVSIALGQYSGLMLVSWSAEFWDKMQFWGAHGGEGQEHRLYAFLLKFLWLAMIGILANVYQSYVTSIFTLNVRAQMTESFLKKWLHRFAYYRMEIMQFSEGDKGGSDNPDQRIAEDVKNHVDRVVDLVVGFLTNGIQIYLFSFQVYAVSPKLVPIIDAPVKGWLVYAVGLYALFAMGCVYIAGWKLELIDATGQRTEADFRWELVSVRRHSEQIALSGAEEVHEQRVLSRFELVRRLVWEQMFLSKKIGITNLLFSQLKEIFPFIFLGPAFLNGKITFGGLMSAARSMGLLESALLWFPAAYPRYVSWRASTDRLIRATDAFKAAQSEEVGAKITKSSNLAQCKSTELAIWLPPVKQAKEDEAPMDKLPDAQMKVKLFDKLDLDMAAGERALLIGPSGAGKTSLLRTLAGVWPHANGRVDLPAGKKGAMFTSTDMFAPPGELREAVAYPLKAKDVDDADILAALETVGLQSFAAGEQGLGVTRYWEFALSAGQKNRLSLARMVLHQPKVAVLDEPVAHIDETNRAKVMGAALDALPPDSVVLVVSHELSADMRALFNVEYTTDEENKSLRKKFRGNVVTETLWPKCCASGQVQSKPEADSGSTGQSKPKAGCGSGLLCV
jgi:putative ATP-binding cassette transporter